jgi:pimeloyl-ACP methyl ester carboxylesterase
MHYVISTDATRIAYDRAGDGPPVILVVGAFNDHTTGTPLAEFLAPYFTVFCYDRRGRGESTDTLPYTVTREVEDLGALIDAAGGSACVFGYSSGACLSLLAAAKDLPIKRLALYDAPYSSKPDPIDHATRLSQFIASGRRGEAVEYFQSRVVGIPDELVAQFRHAPFRPALEAMAPTLVYEAMIIGDRSVPLQLASSVKTQTLLMAGGASAPFMADSARTLAAAMPDARARVVEGQTHDIDPSALGPLLVDFFGCRFLA